MYKKTKHKVHLLLDPSDGGTIWDKVINSIIVVLILLNTFAVILETVDSLFVAYKNIFKGFELERAFPKGLQKYDFIRLLQTAVKISFERETVKHEPEARHGIGSRP